MFVRLSLAAIAAASISTAAMARDYVSMAGSSTVFPFATIVAEAVGKTGLKTPVVESGGSSVGKKGACEALVRNLSISVMLKSHEAQRTRALCG